MLIETTETKNIENNFLQFDISTASFRIIYKNSRIFLQVCEMSAASWQLGEYFSARTSAAKFFATILLPRRVMFVDVVSRPLLFLSTGSF